MGNFPNNFFFFFKFLISFFKKSWTVDLRKDYQAGHDPTKDKVDESEWLHKNLKDLKTFVIGYLESHTHFVYEDEETNLLTLSILHLVEKLVCFGFFVKPEKLGKLLTILPGLLDGRQDSIKGNKDNKKRYNLKDDTLTIMVILLFFKKHIFNLLIL